MHPIRSILAVGLGFGGVGAWAVLDGLLGALAALAAILASVLGIWWGYKTYKVKYAAAKTDKLRAELELRLLRDEREERDIR